MNEPKDILKTPIEYLKGVGPKKGDLLRRELGVHTFGDLLYHFPFRYIDRTQFFPINTLNARSGTVQLKGILRRLDVVGEGRRKRMTGRFRDATGAIDLIWFTGIHWLEKSLVVGQEYVLFGKVAAFRQKLNIAHPELEAVNALNTQKALTFSPVYPSTEKLTAKGLDAKGQRQMMQVLFEKLSPLHLDENLPDFIIHQYKFPSHFEALKQIHFPASERAMKMAIARLKYEELFFLQLRLLQLKGKRKQAIKGFVFEKVGAYFNRFYQEKLPFELTGAQKRVVKEIRQDLGVGIQMNRLLQGDVGSGKTIVGLMCMLIAMDNGFQSCMMAPTEILARQHYISISKYVEGLGIQVDFLSGSVKGKARKEILARLAEGETHIIIGTHALIEDKVVFKNFGLAITDEQHRFGVAQRARLWKKSKPYPPHVLVMTATPIPRTLALTLHGDLDISVIDELPPGRKEIETIHRTEYHRLRVIGFMREEIKKGRQVYVVYPLIEESEKLDLNNLEQGFEALSREFPKPEYQISVVHGKMKAADKEREMQRFVRGETQIMVATTVIEVGVNVPNATVMGMENTERFGLAQLHQLRGRVGRGGEQSYCLLMTGYKLSAEGKERIQTMVRTNNGFEIAEADLKLRGPGDIEGTRQSGVLDLKLVDLAKDGKILQAAREAAVIILQKDPNLVLPEHHRVKVFMEKYLKPLKGWSLIG